MNVLKADKKLAVISALVEGNSIRSTERMTGVHRDTIMRLLVRVGRRCDELTEQHMRNVHARSVQADEIWTYVGRHQRRLAAPELERGDQFVFVAIDADTKLVPAFVVGKRELATACVLMDMLAARHDGGPIQITTDAYTGYRRAIDGAFGRVDYATETKVYRPGESDSGRYSPPRVAGIHTAEVYGSPDPRFISTSYIERNNWTIRTSVRRLTRLSNGFSRKLDNLKAAMSLHFTHYNFVRVHRTIRTTPAQAAGLTSQPWGLQELVA